MVQAHLIAYDNLMATTSHYYGAWVAGGTSVSADSMKVFSSYTSLTDTYSTKSDV